MMAPRINAHEIKGCNRNPTPEKNPLFNPLTPTTCLFIKIRLKKNHPHKRVPEARTRQKRFHSNQLKTEPFMALHLQNSLLHKQERRGKNQK